jgi:alpha-1,2-mannosyltransferase
MLYLLLFTPLILLVTATIYFRVFINREKQREKLLCQLKCDKIPFIIGFFHPYCTSGGGGERVLWTAIKALLDRYENIVCVVYTGDVDFNKDQILARTLVSLVIITILILLLMG